MFSATLHVHESHSHVDCKTLSLMLLKGTLKMGKVGHATEESASQLFIKQQKMMLPFLSACIMLQLALSVAEKSAKQLQKGKLKGKLM